ncbi:nucleoside 2-deoxyribosyltransferase [Leisingera sp. M658]|uniref:nucleoside 2-deoxyribosyltransferase n=1 Tax=Leisingera sp. M658 TaxID=2867015 RepID=UPI0021A95EBB|nr:nucleoside 2-deoxyribosyltransferase [Leisingera sp. M658]UWQ75834.1 nucleoside 2-deoxyribosyltransferase [Leisingera sp. M658]
MSNITDPNPILVVGEVYVDFVQLGKGLAPKMRLGGIIHAARGLWACGFPFAVAGICPSYLIQEATDYLHAHGCTEFIWLGEISSSPNVVFISDVTEVGDQGYEELLRERKSVSMREVGNQLEKFEQIVVFPGKFSLSTLSELLRSNANVTVDIAYGVESFLELECFKDRIQTIVISTSSDLFDALGGKCLDPLEEAARSANASYLLLKENRGGSRLINLIEGGVEEIHATLGETVNSVGVGDVYAAVMAALAPIDVNEATWRGAQAATRYAQTTYPDDLRRDVQRDLKLPMELVRSLGGVSLPWHERTAFNIYLAAPDFSYIDKHELDEAVSALEYHNFNVRRPVQENGEVARPADIHTLREVYNKDLALLEKCDVVFAVPLEKDPGTLVEIGYALKSRTPVITYDPRCENKNTMVMAGSEVFSDSLGECLNGLFSCLSKLRSTKK